MSNTAAKSARKFHLENTIRDCKDYLRESGNLQKDKIKQWAEALEELGTEKTSICTIIINEARDEFGWSAGQLQYIRDVLGPLGYTDSRFSNKPEGKDTLALESLIKALKSQDKEKLKQYGVENPDVLMEYLNATGGAHKLAAYVAEMLNLITKEEKDKIQTYKSDPRACLPYNAVVELIPAYRQAVTYLPGVAQKMYEFPSDENNIEQEQEIADQIGSLMLIQEAINKLWKSCKDEKFSFSLWEHAKMMVREEIYSKHAAAIKTGVKIIDKDGNVTDEIRKMTRERVADEKEQMFEWMKDMSAAMKAVAFWSGFVEWRDVASEINGRVASRKARLSPKLSELA